MQPATLGSPASEPSVHPMHFHDRVDAGRALAAKLMHYAGRPDLIVLALPRGGVPVAFVVAAAIGAPLDVFLVRKVGVPGHEEFAMGAVATGGTTVLNEDAVQSLGVPSHVIEESLAAAFEELARREGLYRNDRPPPDVRHKTVILIDDGLATGSSMLAAVRAVRQLEPDRIVVAAPVAAPGPCEALRALADEVICAATPADFRAVGLWYEDFTQTTDEEVRQLLAVGNDLERPNRDSEGALG